MSDKKKYSDIYYTISNEARAEIKIKGSRFIASANSVASTEQTLEFLNGIRAEFYNATHNCFAYQIGKEGKEYRTSDDGEPSGSAGKPILFAIKKFDLSDIIVVVTRYFGGTKLGVGGLVRAYSDATEAVLQTSEKKPVHLTKKVAIKCSYGELSTVKRLLDSMAVSFQEKYTDSVSITALIHFSEAEDFVKAVISNTNARAKAEILIT